MIDPGLFKDPQPLDRTQHRDQRLKSRATRFDRTAGMNAIFLTAIEFIDAARDYPIVFVEAGKGADGKREVAPMAVLGLAQGENLMLQDDGSWGARYVPALLQGYPFGLARSEGDKYLVVVDAKAEALDAAAGEPLFDDQGNPTPLLEERRKLLEQIETEAERTRLVGRALIEMELLQPMRFDATLPDGKTLTVDGFLAMDEKKFGALPERKLAELHANGMLGLLYAHQFSLRNMRLLVERRLRRTATA
jgi:SapC